MADYEPKTYSRVSSARRAGKRLCEQNGWTAFRVITLGKIYLVAGPSELKKFEAWIKQNQIPINWQRDSHLTLVHHS